MSIAELMTRALFLTRSNALARRGLFVDHDDELAEAFKIMTENDLDSLPVVGPTLEILGVVRQRDAAAAMAAEAPPAS